MSEEEGQEDQAVAADPGSDRLNYSLFRRPDKYKIGEDFGLFVKKCDLYFEAVDLKNDKKRRLALLFNLTEDAFRLAESVEFVEGADAYENWIKRLKSLFERNQTATEKRYNFHRREQQPGESVNSYALSLREAGAKCGFTGEEYSSRLIDQFILGLKDRATQSKLLQEPPKTLDEALLLARRFEAANATMHTLAGVQKHSATTGIGAVNSTTGAANSSPAVPAAKTCNGCNGFGHVAEQCPTVNSVKRKNILSERVCFRCHKPGHIARNCFVFDSQQGASGSKENTSRIPVCFRCNAPGHIARYCKANLDYNATSQQDRSQTQSTSGHGTARPRSGIKFSTVSPASKRKTLMVETCINGKPTLCTVDTGASISLISKDKWQTLVQPSGKPLLPSDIVAEAANNSPIGILGKTTLTVEVHEGLRSTHEFYVAAEITSEIILGLDWLLTNDVVVNIARC